MGFDERFLFSPPMFRLRRPLVLASNSPRRRNFLRDMGIACQIVSPPKDAEPLPEPGEMPEVFAARAAKAKAETVHAVLASQGDVADIAVLGADTVVFREDRMFRKPRDKASALASLRALAGGTHRVRTACYLRLGTHDGGKSLAFFGEAEVGMGEWPEEILAAYARSGEGLDKAGAYAMQGLGAFLIESVRGSWSSVIGLPASETIRVLLETGIIEPIGEQ